MARGRARRGWRPSPGEYRGYTLVVGSRRGGRLVSLRLYDSRGRLRDHLVASPSIAAVYVGRARRAGARVVVDVDVGRV